MVGGQAYDYGPTRCLITSVDLPMMSQITLASRHTPYLCLALALDLQQLADLMSAMGQATARLDHARQGHCGERTADDLARSCIAPAAPVWTIRRTSRCWPPLIEREILFRLLTGEQGLRLRQLAATESRSNKVARAIDWLKRHYDEPLRIDELAQRL